MGLEDRIVETFIILSKESKCHATRLWEIYKHLFRTEKLEEVELPPIEVETLIDKFKETNNILGILELAMQSELLAERIYKPLAKRAKDERMKKFTNIWQL